MSMRYGNIFCATVATISFGTVMIAGAPLSASADPTGPGEAAGLRYDPDTSLISASRQADADAIVAEFITHNPAPENGPGSADAEFAAYNDRLAAYWESVPWEAVVEQWGCAVTLRASVTVQMTDSGTTTVVLEEGHLCNNTIAAEAAGIVESRSAYLADRGIAYDGSGKTADQATSPRGSGPGTDVTLSLGRPVLGQIRAGATFTGSGNAAAFIRLGRSDLGSCVAGAQIATGGSGVWAAGESRSITASVNQNANWSSGWQRDRGTGYNNEGRYCELI